MEVLFANGEQRLLEVNLGEEIVLRGLPEAVLRSVPSFLELEDHLGDTWVFRVVKSPRGNLLFGTLRFRSRGEKLSMEIGLKEKPCSVFPHNAGVFFPEEVASWSHLSGEVVLHPGEYALPPGRSLSGTIRLFGEKGTTVLSGESEVLRLENPREAHFSGITFLHRGTRKGNVVVILGGQVTFESCTFSGGVQEKLTWMGNGLVVARGARVALRHCVFLDNQGAGLVVERGSELLVEHSLFCRNGKEGLSIRGGTSVEIRHSVFRENSWGVALFPGATGQLIASRVEKNRLGGVLISRESQLTISETAITHHPVGIVGPLESILLGKGNVLRHNQRDVLEEG